LIATNGDRNPSNEHQASDQVSIANIYLRQAAIQLVPDSNTTTTDNAQTTSRLGFFTISSLDPELINSPNADNARNAVKLNYRTGVIQATYVKSLDGAEVTVKRNLGVDDEAMVRSGR
jgi:hypothetical protein